MLACESRNKDLYIIWFDETVTVAHLVVQTQKCEPCQLNKHPPLHISSEHQICFKLDR